jgi:regulatory protein
VAAKVTDIRPASRGDDRLTVYVDGSEAFTVSESVAAQLGIAIGAELSAEDTQRLSDGDRRDTIRDAALRLLAVRARSRGELVERLTRKGFAAEGVREVIQSLSEVGLVDDEVFARAWAEERSRLRPIGPRRLARELAQKRVDPELAARVADETFARSPELELARKALAPKLRTGPGRNPSRESRQRRRRRLFAFLVRRGFSYEVASQVVAEAEAQATERRDNGNEGDSDV